MLTFCHPRQGLFELFLLPQAAAVLFTMSSKALLLAVGYTAV